MGELNQIIDYLTYPLRTAFSSGSPIIETPSVELRAND